MTNPETKELKDQIKALEEQLTKSKFKYNSKNADYVLLYQEFEEYKKQKIYLPWLLTLLLALLTLYFYLNHD